MLTREEEKLAVKKFYCERWDEVASLPRCIAACAAVKNEALRDVVEIISAYAVEGGEPDRKVYPADTCEELVARLTFARRDPAPAPQPAHHHDWNLEVTPTVCRNCHQAAVDAGDLCEAPQPAGDVLVSLDAVEKAIREEWSVEAEAIVLRWITRGSDKIDDNITADEFVKAIRARLAAGKEPAI